MFGQSFIEVWDQDGSESFYVVLVAVRKKWLENGEPNEHRITKNDRRFHCHCFDSNDVEECC